MQPLQWDEFKTPGTLFRGAPFWAWNTRLEKFEMQRQLEIFRSMGMGGFTIHSRTGLQTEYLGEEFMDMVAFCIEEAQKQGLQVHLYDEDRWPSGFGGGLVTKQKANRSRYLTLTRQQASGERDENPLAGAFAVNTGAGVLLARYTVRLENGALAAYRRLCEDEPDCECMWYAYLQVSPPSPWFNNQAYANLLDKRVTEDFLQVTHEAYRKAVGASFGRTVASMFTDEPQLIHKRLPGRAEAEEDLFLPFTDDFEESFTAAHGISLLNSLPEVFWQLPGGEVSRVRYLYHEHLAETFAQSYCDVVGGWCRAHGLVLTGHMMGEPTLQSQSEAVGDVMRHYRAFGLPGIDMLRDARQYNTAKQAQSAARQLGARGTASELYGVTGLGFDFRRQKLQGDWQAALGVVHRVHHLSMLGMQGEAKRDYPASFGYQSPWHESYAVLEEYFARVNLALQQGNPRARVAVVDPVESYWLNYGPEEQTGGTRAAMERRFASLTEWLLFGLLDFDFLGESLLESLTCDVTGGRLRAGEMEYEAIVVPACLTLRENTMEMLLRFAGQGGRVFLVGDAPRYVAALPDTRCDALATACVCLPFEQAAVLAALEPYRDIDLRDSRGNRCDRFVYQLRETGEGAVLFLANGRPPQSPEVPVIEPPPLHNPDVPAPLACTLRVRGRYHALQLNAMTGEQAPLPSRHNGSWTEIDTQLFEQDSLLLRLSTDEAALPAQAPSCDSDNNLHEHAVLNQVAEYSMAEPNVLLLDLAEFNFDAQGWQPAEEILRLDNRLRRQLGYPLKLDALAQPWAVPAAQPQHSLALRYSWRSDVPLEGLCLAAELPEGATARLNGFALPLEADGWYIDKCIHTYPLPPLPKGLNRLELLLPYGPGTNLEPCFLLGSFAVALAGTSATLRSLPQQVGFGDLASQGFPFYGGSFTYHCEVNLPNGSYVLAAPKYRAPLLTVQLNGGDAQPLFLSPCRLPLGRLEGRQHISITSVGSRANTLGPLHLADGTQSWFGPSAWRSEGDAFSYEYQLGKAGVLAAPRLLVIDE